MLFINNNIIQNKFFINTYKTHFVFYINNKTISIKD